MDDRCVSERRKANFGVPNETLLGLVDSRRTRWIESHAASSMLVRGLALDMSNSVRMLPMP